MGALTTYTSELKAYDDFELANFSGSTWFTQKSGEYADRIFKASLLFAGAFYGLIHLLARNGAFTMLHERWMWRVSCFIIASLLPVVTRVTASFKLFEFLELEVFMMLEDITLFRWLTASLSLPFKMVHWFFPGDSFQFKVIWYTVSMLICLVYIAARVYLIVECFINVTHLPPAVYPEPEWSQYLPHSGAG